MKGTKICTKCSHEKSTDDFKKSSRSPDGHYPQCKTCEARYRESRAEVHRTYMKTYYLGNKAKYAKKNTGYYEKHKAKLNEYSKEYYEKRRKNDLNSDIFYRVRSRAKKAGIPFNLTPDDIVIPAVCPVLGIRIQANDKKGPLPSSPSLDRIRPALGYVKGNVRVISNRANTLKCDATVEELEKVLLDLRELQSVPLMLQTG